MKKLLKKDIYKIFLILLLIFSLKGVNAYADELGIGATPVIQNNITIPKGESKELKITVVNTSLYPENVNIDNYKCKVNLSVKDKEIAKMIEFEENNFELAPNETKDVKIIFTNNSDLFQTEKTIEILITGIFDVNGQVNNNLSINPTISALFNINDGSRNLKEAAEVVDFKIVDNLEKKTILETIKGLFFSKNIKENWEELLYKPYKISITKDGIEHIYYDIVKSKKVPMKNVITTDESKINNSSKYILLSKEINSDETISKIEFLDNKIKLTTNKDSYELLINNKQIFVDIKEKINNFASNLKQGEKFTFDELTESIIVFKNAKNKQLNLYGEYTIKNIGEKVLNPIGVMTTFNENQEKVAESNYGTTLISPNTIGKISASLNYDKTNYSNGTYRVNSYIELYTSSNDGFENDCFITFVSFRIYIFIAILLLILLTIFIIYKVYKKYKKKKENKGGNDEVENDDMKNINKNSKEDKMKQDD